MCHRLAGALVRKFISESTHCGRRPKVVVAPTQKGNEKHVHSIAHFLDGAPRGNVGFCADVCWFGSGGVSGREYECEFGGTSVIAQHYVIQRRQPASEGRGGCGGAR